MSKAILITGASRGIGLATAMEFLENDPDTTELILVARKSSHADESFKELQKLNKRGIKISKYGYDLSSEDDVEKFLEELAKNHPNVDVLINNAGFTKPEPIQQIDMADFRTTMQVNLYAPFRIVQGLLSQMKFPKTIVNVASTAGMTGRSGWLTYGASKAAMINMSQVMKEELGFFGTDVVCISPGRCATDLRKTLAPDEDPSTIMQPNDVAEIIRHVTTKPGLALDTTNIVVRR